MSSNGHQNTQQRDQSSVGVVLRRMTLASLGLDDMADVGDSAWEVLADADMVAGRIVARAERLVGRLAMPQRKPLPSLLREVRERYLPVQAQPHFGPSAVGDGPRTPTDLGPWRQWLNAVFLVLFDEETEHQDLAEGAGRPMPRSETVQLAVSALAQSGVRPEVLQRAGVGLIRQIAQKVKANAAAGDRAGKSEEQKREDLRRDFVDALRKVEAEKGLASNRGEVARESILARAISSNMFLRADEDHAQVLPSLGRAPVGDALMARVDHGEGFGGSTRTSGLEAGASGSQWAGREGALKQGSGQRGEAGWASLRHSVFSAEIMKQQPKLLGQGGLRLGSLRGLSLVDDPTGQDGVVVAGQHEGMSRLASRLVLRAMEQSGSSGYGSTEGVFLRVVEGAEDVNADMGTLGAYRSLSGGDGHGANVLRQGQPASGFVSPYPPALGRAGMIAESSLQRSGNVARTSDRAGLVQEAKYAVPPTMGGRKLQFLADPESVTEGMDLSGGELPHQGEWRRVLGAMREETGRLERRLGRLGIFSEKRLQGFVEKAQSKMAWQSLGEGREDSETPRGRTMSFGADLRVLLRHLDERREEHRHEAVYTQPALSGVALDGLVKEISSLKHNLARQEQRRVAEIERITKVGSGSQRRHGSGTTELAHEKGVGAPEAASQRRLRLDDVLLDSRYTGALVGALGLLQERAQKSTRAVGADAGRIDAGGVAGKFEAMPLLVGTESAVVREQMIAAMRENAAMTSRRSMSRVIDDGQGLRGFGARSLVDVGTPSQKAFARDELEKVEAFLRKQVEGGGDRREIEAFVRTMSREGLREVIAKVMFSAPVSSTERKERERGLVAGTQFRTGEPSLAVKELAVGALTGRVGEDGVPLGLATGGKDVEEAVRNVGAREDGWRFGRSVVDLTRMFGAKKGAYHSVKGLLEAGRASDVEVFRETLIGALARHEGKRVAPGQGVAWTDQDAAGEGLGRAGYMSDGGLLDRVLSGGAYAVKSGLGRGEERIQLTYAPRGKEGRGDSLGLREEIGQTHLSSASRQSRELEKRLASEIDFSSKQGIGEKAFVPEIAKVGLQRARVSAEVDKAVGREGFERVGKDVWNIGDGVGVSLRPGAFAEALKHHHAERGGALLGSGDATLEMARESILVSLGRRGVQVEDVVRELEARLPGLRFGGDEGVQGRDEGQKRAGDGLRMAAGYVREAAETRAALDIVARKQNKEGYFSRFVPSAFAGDGATRILLQSLGIMRGDERKDLDLASRGEWSSLSRRGEVAGTYRQMSSAQRQTLAMTGVVSGAESVGDASKRDGGGHAGLYSQVDGGGLSRVLSRYGASSLDKVALRESSSREVGALADTMELFVPSGVADAKADIARRAWDMNLGLTPERLVGLREGAQMKASLSLGALGQQGPGQQPWLQDGSAAAVGEFFRIGSGEDAQRRAQRVESAEMLTRVERLLDRAEQISDHGMDVVMPNELRALARVLGDRSSADEQGLPMWRRKGEQFQGVDLVELREMLRQVGAVPVQGSPIELDRHLVSPFVGGSPAVEHGGEPLFGVAGSETKATNEVQSQEQGFAAADAGVPPYEELMLIAEEVYRRIMEKLREELQRRRSE